MNTAIYNVIDNFGYSYWFPTMQQAYEWIKYYQSNSERVQVLLTETNRVIKVFP